MATGPERPNRQLSTEADGVPLSPRPRPLADTTGGAAAIDALAPGEVHVWWARLGGTGIDGILDVDEHARRARFRHAEDRDLYGLAHGLKRQALSRYAPVAPADWRFIVESHGKPALAPDFATRTALTFSLSHSCGTAAVAIGRAMRIGIDVEPIDRAIDPDEIARAVLAPGEIVALAGLDDHAKSRAFITLWTLKEAYVKGLGLGLSHPLTSCAFTVALTDGAVTAQLGPGEGSWGFEHRLVEARDALSIAYEISIPSSKVVFRGRWS